MQINLFVVIAQIINFFVLLFILRKFFFKPVANIMEKRKQSIEENIENAERIQDEANKLIDQYEHKIREIEREKSEIMLNAQKEAAEYKRNLLDEFQVEAEEQKLGFFMEVDEEKEIFAAEVRNLIVKGTLDLTRNLLGNLSREDLDNHLFSAFLEKVASFQLEEPRKRASGSDVFLLLISSSQIEDKKKSQLESILRDNHFKFDAIDYRVDSQLGVGYVLQMPDFTIDSSISHYLDMTQEQLLVFLEEAARDRSDSDDTQ